MMDFAPTCGCGSTGFVDPGGSVVICCGCAAPFSVALKPVVRDYATLVRNLIQARTRRFCRAAEDSTDGSFDFPGAFAAQVFKIFESVMEEGEADAVALCRELGFNPDDGTTSPD